MRRRRITGKLISRPGKRINTAEDRRKHTGRMELTNFEELIDRAKKLKDPGRVAVAGGAAEHVIEAVLKAKEDGLCVPILVGDKAAIRQVICGMGLNPDDFEICSCYEGKNESETCVELIREKKADILMKGTPETSDFLRPIVKKENNLRTGRTMSHVTLFKIPQYHKMICNTDGGVTPYPTFDQKVDILINAVDTLHKLGYECPKAAVLCCKEKVDLKMPETVDAGKLHDLCEAGELGNCCVEGPISYDLAFDKEVARLKHYDSPYVGDFDILLHHDIHSGNVVGKMFLTHMGGRMSGIIMGCKVPIIMTSRGSGADEKYLSIAMASVAAAAQQE